MKDPLSSFSLCRWEKWGREQLVSCLRLNMKVLFAQSCLTVCDPMDCSPPGSSVHRTLQARILEWVVIFSSRGSSHPSIKPMSPMSPALACGFFTIELCGKTPDYRDTKFIKVIRLKNVSQNSRSYIGTWPYCPRAERLFITIGKLLEQLWKDEERVLAERGFISELTIIGIM